jgi:hypothetical protein
VEGKKLHRWVVLLTNRTMPNAFVKFVCVGVLAAAFGGNGRRGRLWITVAI